MYQYGAIARVDSVDVQLNQSLSTISGTIKVTLTNWLTALSQKLFHTSLQNIFMSGSIEKLTQILCTATTLELLTETLKGFGQPSLKTAKIPIYKTSTKLNAGQKTGGRIHRRPTRICHLLKENHGLSIN